MSLTTKKLQKLNDQEFPQLYEEYEDKWRELLATTVKFFDQGLDDAEKIQADDIAESLVKILEIDRIFKRYVDDHKLRQAYWANYFAEYIVDKAFGTELVPRKKGTP